MTSIVLRFLMTLHYAFDSNKSTVFIINVCSNMWYKIAIDSFLSKMSPHI